MPVFRIILGATSVLLAGLYVYDGSRGYGFFITYPVSEIVARRWPEADEFHPGADPGSAAAAVTTPAARVRETFAMFDARRRVMQRSL